ncbi:MAG: hypothetical protein J3Q66DRAFT_336593 [Benniella sp.]|nr:MAG: hypothetical protein J3Q66DRAFT_336593 [Benniella sp.]
MPFQSSPTPPVDQIPTFSNSQGAVAILVAILAREPELRDKILKETIADQKSSAASNKWKSGHKDGDDDDDDYDDSDDDDDNGTGNGTWRYSQWIGYLKEIIKMCGVDIPSPPAFSPASGSGSKVETGQGTSMLSSGLSGTPMSLFSLDNMKKRRHTAASLVPSLGSSGIKYEPGEDREVLAYLTAHLELISKLIFDMYISSPGIAFARAIQESRLEGYLQRVRSTFIQNQDLGAQIEDLIIQLSTIPSTAHFNTSLLPHDLPSIPPFDALPFQRQRPISPLEYQYPLPDAKYGAQVVPRATSLDIPSRGIGLELSSSDRYSPINGFANNQKPVYGGGLARNPSQMRPSPSQRTPQQPSGGTGTGANKSRKGSVADESKAQPSVGGSRQASAKRTSMDKGNYSQPSTPQTPRQTLKGEKGQMAPANGFYRDLQAHTSTIPTLASTGRRATLGEIVPISTGFKAGVSSGSKLPVIPPKSRNRPTSMDGKIRGSELLPGIAYTTIKLDQPQYQQSRPAMNVRLASAPATRTVDKGTEANRATNASRSNSTSTFGQGRRGSLNSGDNPAPFLATSDSHMSLPSSGISRIYDGSQSFNSLNMDGGSSYSSATSSGFSATSISSVSPPSTQTRKHSMLATNGPSSKSLALGNDGNYVGHSRHITPSSPPPLNSSSKQAGSSNGIATKSTVAEKGFRDVDFDNQIQEDVRKLASSSSLSSFGIKRSEDIRETDSKVKKLEIQASDPHILDAPIVVPEDMTMIKGQYLQEQLSGIVLPPMESKRAHENVGPDATRATPRRVSVSGNSYIPVATPSSPPVSSSNNYSRMFSEQSVSNSSAIPRPSPGARRRSVEPSTPRPLSFLGTSNDNNKTKITERIKVFERA